MEKAEQLALFNEDGKPYSMQDKKYDETKSENETFVSKSVTYDEFLNDPKVHEFIQWADKTNPNGKVYFEDNLKRLREKYQKLGFKPCHIRLFRYKKRGFGAYRLSSFYAKYKYHKSDYLLERLDGMTVNSLQKDFNSTLYKGAGFRDNLAFQKHIKGMAHGVLKYFKASDFENVSVAKNVVDQMFLEHNGMAIRIDAMPKNLFNVLVFETPFESLPTVFEYRVTRKEAFKALYDGITMMDKGKE